MNGTLYKGAGVWHAGCKQERNPAVKGTHTGEMTMNKTVMLAAMAFSAAMAMQAQSIRVNVPHPIQAGKVTAAAGVYEVRPVTPGSTVVYQFRHTTGTDQFLVPMSSRLGPNEKPSQVVLRCTTELCQVKEVWIGGWGAGRRVDALPGAQDVTVQMAGAKR
jgi:hypothetical protein